MDQLTRHICALAALPTMPADRIEILPLGEFRLADKRGAQAMRITDAIGLIKASLAAAPGNVLPIDFDHRSFAEQGMADSRAAGWISEMSIEGDRITASVEWTAEGRRALEDRSYRFISPVFKTRKNGEVVLIEGAGLVNTPAIPQLRQLASKETQMNPIDMIAEILGIAADKTDEIVARVKALAGADTQLASIVRAAKVEGDDTVTQICARLTAAAPPAPNPAHFVPKVAFDALQTQFASLKKDVDGDRVEQALERARDAGKLTPDLEPWATQLASKDLAEFEAWVAVAPVRVNITGQRQLAGKQAPVKSDALDPMERQIASMMGVSEEKFLATRNAAVKEA